MKKFYSLLGLLMVSLAIFAAPVSREQAMGEARAFLLKNVQSRSGMRLAPARQSLTVGTADEAYYVFNVGTDQGFVLVSADDRTPAILGYADQGTFDAATCPAPMKSFLAGLADQIRMLDAVPQQKAAPRRVIIKRAISPLLQTVWNQEKPYNNDCPEFFNTEKYGETVTGCVATAMSQVLNYYQWPAATKAAIPAYTCPTEFTGLGSISVPEVPAGTKLDWANMVYDYVGQETDEQEKAVALLMFATGASVGMDYRSDASGGSNASNANIPAALVNYFDYSASAKYVQRENYLLDEWNTMIYNELKAQRVVIMGGQSSGGGHAFVIDGYSSDDYFHINWGWGGMDNGYFLLSVCNPGSSAGYGASTTSDGYSYKQDAVVGIEPNKGQAVKNTVCRMIIELVKAEGNEVTANFYSQMEGSNIFNFGLGYVKEDGSLQPIEGWQTSQEPLEQYVGYKNAVFPVKGLADGTYKILPIGKLASDTEWLSPLNPSITYVEAEVRGGEVKLTLVNPVADLKVKSLRAQAVPMQGVPLALDLEIDNAGDEFYGLMYLRQGSDPVPVARLGVSLPARTTTKVTFYFTPAEAGTFDFAVSTDMLKYSQAGSLTINAAPTGTAELAVTDLTVNNREEGNPFGNVYGLLSGKVNVKNSGDAYFKGNIAFVIGIYKVNNDGDFEYVDFDYYFKQIEVPAGSEVPVDFEFTGLVDGYYYFPQVSELYADQNKIVLFHNGAIVYDREGNREGVKAGGTFNVPAEAIAVHFKGDCGLEGVTGGNPNTLYFFDAEATVPASMTKNVVQGAEAQNIVLEDGHPFMSPIGFVAKNISYTRTFKPALGAQGGWETIALPFDVTAVKADGKDITWLGSNAAFQLMEFTNERNENAYFTGAKDFEAMMPYLIGFPAQNAEITATFSGKDTFVGTSFKAVLTGQNLKMEGFVEQQSVDGVLTLNAAGSAFVKADGKVAPFRAYFAPTASASRRFDTVNIVAGSFTDVQTLRSAGEAAAEWYTIDGRRVMQPKQGIYVRGGKKVIVK